jgi:DNA uptake protein ComE-like DNA-binding protein
MRRSVTAMGARRPMAPVTSVLWALVPLVTLGWGTGFSFAYAAVRLRDAALGWWAAGYFVAGATSLTLIGVSNSQGGGWRGTLGGVLAFALIGLGSAHAFGIRPHLVDPSATWRRKRVVSVQEQALAEARSEMQRRSEARRIAAVDPELARQLCIGRPDLPRQYRDGGLVDANHAPASVLASLPGIGSALADQIVSDRTSVGGFRDLTDMSITLGVAPQTLDEASTFLVFSKSGSAQ